MMAIAALVLLEVPIFTAQDRKEVVIEMSAPQDGGGGLGTGAYGPTDKEGPFQKKITEKPVAFWSNVKMPKPSNLSDEEWAKMQKEDEKQREKEKGKSIPEDKYQLAEQSGQYVGWLGILRESVTDDKTKTTTLRVEHKYFDGLVDLHQMIVSLFGGGDFTATLPKSKTAIPALSLVRIYGKVAKDRDGGVTIKAEYVRVWDWGLFAFMDYGKDRSNPKWVELRKSALDRVYSARPDPMYYEARLGKRAP